MRAGRGELNPVEEAEIGQVKGLKVLHLQCHFGADTLCLAQRGAFVVGLDFSSAAIAAARDLAVELGLAQRARFVHSDLYDAPSSIAEPASFDLVYTSWGATCWLPDIGRWAGIVAHFLKPGGRLYYADAHPAAYVFDDLAKLPDGKPGYFAPYFERKPLVMVDHRDYADPTAHLVNATNVNWLHPLSDILGGLPCRPLFVILSEAKDLMPVASGDEVLRFAQDDRRLGKVKRASRSFFSSTGMPAAVLPFWHSSIATEAVTSGNWRPSPVLPR